jgi:endonuclease/exonuclease/phosphatase (EEP) superfamily protein YafD
MRQISKKLTIAAQVTEWIYAGAILVYLIGRLLMGERWTWVEIGNSLLPMLLFPALFFLPLALLMQRWKLLFINLLPLGLLAVLYLPFFLPKPTVPLENRTPLRLLTFNLGSYIRDETQLVSIIRSTDAEIVALQELLPSQTQTLTRELAAVYPYQALHPIEGFARGVGIFSQYPIASDRYLKELSLGGQRTRLIYNDSLFTIFNVHPTSPRVLGGFDSSLRRSEIEQIIALARVEVYPVLIMGDFNITDQNDDYAKITAHYGDTFRAVGTGFGLTFPNLAQFAQPLGLFPPLLRIDYVFYSAAWIPIDAYVIQENGDSDHYPLYVELSLTSSH